MSRVLIAVLLLGFAGCGAQSDFNRARRDEARGRYQAAWEGYQRFVADHPDHDRAPEALFRAGWVAQRARGDCHMARVFYDAVIARYPASETWTMAASLGLMNCPDYFPLITGTRWVEGDSDSKGAIARTVIEAEPFDYGEPLFPSQAGVLRRTIYAGEKRFRETESIYKKDRGRLLVFDAPTDSEGKTVLSWPLDVGTRWRSAEDGRVVLSEIVSTGEKVTVAAGVFENCVKVKTSVRSGSGARYEYFAPGVGRVLTTLSSRGGEKRNTELLSYEPVPWPDFEGEKENS